MQSVHCAALILLLCTVPATAATPASARPGWVFFGGSSAPRAPVRDLSKGHALARIALCVASDPTGRFAAVGEVDGFIEVVDLVQRRVVRSVRLTALPQGALDVLFVDGGRKVIAHSRHAMCEWDIGARRVRNLRLTEEGSFDERILKVSPDGRWMATDGTDERGRTWIGLRSTLTGKLLKHIHSGVASATRRAGQAPVDALVAITGAYSCGSGVPYQIDEAQFSPDGTRLATSFDGRLRLWSVPAGRRLASATTHFDNYATLAFSQDGARVAVARDRLKVFDGLTAAAVADVETGYGASKVAYRTDSREVALLGDRTIHSFTTADLKPHLSLSLGPLSTVVHAIAWAPAHHRILAACGDAGLAVFDGVTGALIDRVPVAPGNDLGRDGRRVPE